VLLQQVFMNLIGNAIHHNDRVEPRVDVGAEPSPEGWEFFVRDNGPGIPQRYHAQVWGLFQTLKAKQGTTGIGLAIVRRIVEASGGRTWIESTPGHGATFRFTWPNAPAPPRGTGFAR
jgi:signal transduction histidine kinase